MSRSPYFYVERYDVNTKQYELQHPLIWNWDHSERITADLFPYNGCHDLFSIVEKKGYGNSFPEMKGIHKGLPKDVCKDIKESYDKCSYDENWSGVAHHYEPTARWFTYADMYIYCLEHPEAVDYDAMDEAYENAEEGEKIEKIMTPTPMMTLKNRVDAFMEVTDDWDWRNDYSLIRIVYWII